MITIETLIAAVAEAYQVELDTVAGATAGLFSRPRSMAIWAARRLLDAEPAAIVAAFGCRVDAVAVAIARIEESRRRDPRVEQEIEEIAAALVAIDDALETVAVVRAGLQVDGLATAQAIVGRRKPAAMATWREIEAMAAALVHLAACNVETPPAATGLPSRVLQVPVIPAPLAAGVRAVLKARENHENARFSGRGERSAEAALHSSLDTLSNAWSLTGAGARSHG